MKIGIIGGGTFGTSIANAVQKAHKILIYTRNKDVAATINTKRRNDIYFPNKILSKTIKATTEIQDINESDIVLLCLPSHLVLEHIKELKLKTSAIIINGAKGFGSGTILIPESISQIVPNKVFSLKGPSFANELIFELPTAFTLACEKEYFDYIQSIFRTELIILDHTTQIKGIEYLSIVKNIYAIVVGIVDAYYNSSNVRFMIFTKSINEIHNILLYLNIPREVLLTYAGIGDFGLTALNDLSRNRTLGLLIGKGFIAMDSQTRAIVEGLKSIETITKLIPLSDVSNLPLLSNLLNLLKQKIDVKKFINLALYK